jgi:peptidoglycan/xylan/chitin deacetylase (PgdA/CDA1 family)
MLKSALIIQLLVGFMFTVLAQNSWIRINQLGYSPNSIKVAVLASKDDLSIKSFEIIDILTEETVFRSQNIQTHDAYAGFHKILRLNFSKFQESGTFYIRAGNVRSSHFKILNDIYVGAADFLLKYLRQQRCGYNPFLQDSCHTHDGFIVDHPALDSMYIDVTGGWHDASDYLQYVTTSANATYQMLFAYQENPHSFSDEYDKNGDPGANGVPDILDEAKWGLDWLDKMNPEFGLMFNQIADDRDHTTFTLPTLDSVSYGIGRERPVYYITGKPQGLGKFKNRTTGVSSTAAKFASAFALGSEMLKTHYPEFCKRIASKAYEAYRFAKIDLGVCQTASYLAPYFYEEDNYVDDMELAAAQLYIHSKNPEFLMEAIYWGTLEPVTPWMSANNARHYQWYPFVNLGHYRIAQMADSLNRAEFIGFLRKGIDEIRERGKENGFYMGIPFIWCSNNLVVAALTQLKLYHKLTGDTRYREMETALRDWLFGCNPWGTSMIVGYPEDGDTPVDPHSALSAVYKMAIDGGLVDGPVYTSIFKRLRGQRMVNEDEYTEFQSELCVYHDDYGDYSTNEPTMDGTASLCYYLSSLDTSEKGIPFPGFVLKYGGIVRGDTSSRDIHLVFTGADYSDGGEHIRETLKKNKVPAHFFFTGDFYRDGANKKLIEGLRDDGHYLGAHSDKHLLYASWDRRDSLLITREEFVEDLANNYKEMEKFGITKKKARLFMPPYEWYNQTISWWVKELELILVNFTPGTRSNADYTTPDMGEKYVSSDRIYHEILNYERHSHSGLNGFILLIHIGTHPDRTDKFYYKLDDLISELLRREYRFTLLDFWR